MPDSVEAVGKISNLIVEGIGADTGIPSHNRRLSDKVLAAFNHAYAVGEIEMATELRRILAKLETQRVLAHSQRKPNTVALSQADLWVAFVEARNDYREACEDDSLDNETVSAVLERMKDAYQRWSRF